MRHILIILLISLSACSAKKGVFYEEMNKTLAVKSDGNKLILYTGNSKNFSAYFIYEIKTKVDKTKKELCITAFHATHKDNKDKFEIDLKQLGIENIQEYKIIWVDPDGKNINLQLEKNK
ncbi:MAG: hypothetical protein HY958_05835 [Bacteroidia bacterium]|nr:hypothetical protein [Bacteroidia bacterium]